MKLLSALYLFLIIYKIYILGKNKQICHLWRETSLHIFSFYVWKKFHERGGFISKFIMKMFSNIYKKRINLTFVLRKHIVIFDIWMKLSLYIYIHYCIYFSTNINISSLRKVIVWKISKVNRLSYNGLMYFSMIYSQYKWMWLTF